MKKQILLFLLFVPFIRISQIKEIDKVRIYLDCYCDNAFIKRNISYEE